MLEKLKDYVGQFVFLRSLRARLFLIIMLVGIVPVTLMRLAIVESYEEHAVAHHQRVVQNQLRILADHLISQNYLENYRLDDAQSVAVKEIVNAELEMLSNLYGGRVLIIDGSFRIIKDTYGISEGKTIISEEVIKCFKGESVSNYDPENGYIAMTTPITVTVTEKGKFEETPVERTVVKGAMLTSISNASIITTMETMTRKAAIQELLIMMIVLVLAIFWSIFLTRPMKRIADAVNAIQAGYSDDAISVPGYQETAKIVEAFNQLLHRMKVLDDSRQEFVSNVSHELKTPLTSMKVLADSLVTQDNVPVEFYREFMEDIVSEIDRENRIITDLLSLVKLDKKVQDMNIAAVSMNDLTELILKRLRPIARKMDVEVVYESNRTVVAEVDEVKMTLIMSNLVENAIKYNREHGWVKVVLDADHQYFSFKVSDSGVGIPEESLNQIYERFYRVDKSHSREIGGTGLGLAITRSAVLMHRGSISVTSTVGEGTTFLVKIPLSYIPFPQREG